MGRVVHLPIKEESSDVITIRKNEIMINGVKCESMDLDEFLQQSMRSVSPESEERLIIGLLQIIKEECVSNWKLMKMVREIFKGDVKK